MKKIRLITLLFVAINFGANAQYTTEYPFDSTWVDNFTGTVFNIIDYGATPDDTINDSEAFRLVADAIEMNGGGKLVIPDGVYIVGEQQIDNSPNTIYYQYQEIFTVSNVNQLIIEGSDNTIIKGADNLAFGSFDPVTGVAYYDNNPNDGFTDPLFYTAAYIMFHIKESENIFIHNIELDGNLESMNIGGYWGDLTSRQNEAIGIFTEDSKNILLRDIYSHHHGLDGIEVAYYGLEEGDDPTVVVLENTTCEYNSRQGLSWIGGIGLTAYNCQFNHTSKVGFTSNPAAGVDIEAEGSICRGGKFIDCEFLNNDGVGMVCDSGPGGYSTFENCTFWGTTNYPIWVTKPAVKFYNCNIYGMVPNAYGDSIPELATSFNSCLFEDKIHSEYGIDSNDWLMFIWAPGPNVSFNECNFVANNRKSFKVTNGDGDFIFTNCTITHRDTSLADGDKICSIEGSTLNNVTIIDDFPSGFDRNYWIETYFTNVENCVFLEGNNTRFEYVGGYSGWIESGQYPRNQTLAIFYPNGTEAFNTGDTLNILWDPGSASDNVEILLYNDCYIESIIESNTDNDGSFSWVIPDSISSGNEYKIKIGDINEQKDFDFIDTQFSIENITVAVNDFTESHLKFNIYPNPVQDNLNISYNVTEYPNVYNIKIIDIIGRIIQKSDINNHNNKGLIQINVANIPAGIYFCSINTEDKNVYTFKLIKD